MTIRVARHSFMLRIRHSVHLAKEDEMKGMVGGTEVAVWQKVRTNSHGTNGDRDLQALPARYSVRPQVTLQSRLGAVASNPDFVAIAIFCAIGLLATLNLLLRIPELGIM
jgi:hypothetical protein